MAIGASVFLCALAAQAAAARAEAGRPPSEVDRIGRVLEDALHKHGGDVHRCFERALADRLDVAGTLELAVEVGGGGRVMSTAVDRDAVGSPVLLACLREQVAGWSLPGIDAGTTVIMPLAFQAQPSQFSVKAADVPERGPGAAPAGDKPGSPGAPASAGPQAKSKTAARPGKGAPPFSVKLLVDEATMRARKASLSVLTIGPASRIALHKHPGAELLYVVKGHARILGPAGTRPQKLNEGSAAFIAPGMPHVLENMGRQNPAVLLQVFAPPGPERVYRDPADAVGRAAFEVIRDPKTAKAPPSPPAPITVVDSDKVQPLPIFGGKGKVRILLEQTVSGSPAAALDLVEFEPGTEVPRHQHAGAAEILYVLGGSGELTIGSEKLPFGPDQAIHIPEDQPHAARFTGTEKTVVVQIYAPAGAEQRFKQPVSGAPAVPQPPAPAPARR